jgi:hypothetical protein
MNYCSLKDAFPNIKNKNLYSDSNDDNIKLSKKINTLEKKEVIEPKEKVDVPIDSVANIVNHKLFKKMEDELKKMQDELINFKNSKSDESIIEGFSLGIENDQFNELILYICTCIFFIFLFDYMYYMGRKSY